MNALEQSTNALQKEIIAELKGRGDIGIFDFAERVPSIPGAVRFGDIIVEPNGDAYHG